MSADTIAIIVLTVVVLVLCMKIRSLTTLVYLNVNSIYQEARKHQLINERCFHDRLVKLADTYFEASWAHWKTLSEEERKRYEGTRIK